MNREEYDAIDAMSNSRLKAFATCPETYWRTYIAGEMQPPPRTEAMQFGCDVETWLEHGRIDATAIPRDALSASGSRAGKAWKDFEAEHAGERLMKQLEYENLKASLTWIDAQIEAHEGARRAIRNAKCWQAGVTWQCNSTGMECKALLDIDGGDYICDVKTSAHIDPQAWLRQAINLRYHWQAATYLEHADHEQFVFLVIQNVPPYRVELFELEDELLAVARRQIVAARADYLAAMETPGPWRSRTHGGLYTIPTPAWVLRDYDLT